MITLTLIHRLFQGPQHDYYGYGVDNSGDPNIGVYRPRYHFTVARKEGFVLDPDESGPRIL